MEQLKIENFRKGYPKDERGKQIWKEQGEREERNYDCCDYADTSKFEVK